jgi:hypothetical protein
MDKKPATTIRRLYPDLSDEKLTQAEDGLERYLALVLRIFERLESEADSTAVPLTPDTDAIRYES